MIKVTLVLAFGLVATMALRRQSAALRHRILAATVAAAALMPLVEAVAPAWRLPLLPARGSQFAPALTLGDASGNEAVSVTGVAQVFVSSAPAIPPVLGAVWAFGAGLSLLLLAAGIARLLAVACRARPIADVRWAEAAAVLSERSGLARTPTIVQSSHPTLLFTWGFRRPKVLVPRDAGTWRDERVRIVLGHELAHIRRGDWAVQLLADAVRCVYWFNPLVWIVCRRLRLESEHACDDAVLRLGVTAPDYAGQLLDLARLFRHSRRAFFPAPAMARSSDLERRVRVMLNTRMDRSPVGRVSGWLVALGLVALTVPIAGLSLSAATTQAAANPQQVASVPTVATPPAEPASAAVAPRAVERARAAENPSQAGASSAFKITVTDQNGRTVPNVVVSLSNEAAGLRPELRTGPDGEGAASGLPPGECQLTVRRPGFKTAKMNVKLEPGKTTISRVTLQLGMLAETLVVSAPAGAASIATPAPQARHVGTAPSEDPCSQSPDGGCVTPPRRLVDAKPIYPAWLAQTGKSGTVVIKGRVLTDGSVGDMQPAPDADPDFANAAMQAIRLWEYSPTRLNGVPMEVQIEVTVMFVAQKK